MKKVRRKRAFSPSNSPFTLIMIIPPAQVLEVRRTRQSAAMILPRPVGNVVWRGTNWQWHEFQVRGPIKMDLLLALTCLLPSLFKGKCWQVRVFVQEPGWHRRYLPGPHTQGRKESKGGDLLVCGGGRRHREGIGKQVRLPFLLSGPRYIHHVVCWQRKN